MTGPHSEQLGRLAAEKGIQVEERGGELYLAFAAPTAEEALERLRLLAGLLAPKG